MCNNWGFCEVHTPHLTTCTPFPNYSSLPKKRRTIFCISFYFLPYFICYLLQTSRLNYWKRENVWIQIYEERLDVSFWLEKGWMFVMGEEGKWTKGWWPFEFGAPAMDPMQVWSNELKHIISEFSNKQQANLSDKSPLSFNYQPII